MGYFHGVNNSWINPREKVSTLLIFLGLCVLFISLKNYKTMKLKATKKLITCYNGNMFMACSVRTHRPRV